MSCLSRSRKESFTNDTSIIWALIPYHSHLLLLLNCVVIVVVVVVVVLRALRKIDVHLISTLVNKSLYYYYYYSLTCKHIRLVFMVDKSF